MSAAAGGGVHVALLRGINVGTGPRIAMAQLRDVAASLGWLEVRTHLQSGNVVFRAPGADAPADLASALRTAVLTGTGLDPPVVVLTAGELAEVAAGSPFRAEAVAAPKTVHAVVLSVTAGPGLVARVADAQARLAGSGGDRAVVLGRAVHLHLPGGLGTSRLAAALTRPSGLGPDVVATARNAATVAALLAMTAPQVAAREPHDEHR